MLELYCSNLHRVCTILRKTIQWRSFTVFKLNIMFILCECHFGMMTFEFQTLKPVKIEEIFKYFLFGFLSLVDLLRLLSSWTLGFRSEGLEAETLGMVLLLSPIPGGTVATPLLPSCSNPWFFLTTNFGALLPLWLWALSFPALLTVLFILELWTLCAFAWDTNFTIGLNTLCTFAFGTFSTTDWDTFSSFGWNRLCTL